MHRYMVSLKASPFIIILFLRQNLVAAMCSGLKVSGVIADVSFNSIKRRLIFFVVLGGSSSSSTKFRACKNNLVVSFSSSHH